MPSALLTKSRYMHGIQCPKYLWVEINEPARIPPHDNTTLDLFKQGNLVGQLAKLLFPEGVNTPIKEFMGNVKQTRRLIDERKTIFEAGMLANSVYSRIDIFHPVNENEWDIFEVKSSTRLKDEYIDEVSYQKYCCEQAGLKIRNSIVVYLSKEYIKDGDINPEDIFTKVDISDEVSDRILGIEKQVSELTKCILHKNCPDITIGANCKKPNPCPLKDSCWSFLPEDHVFNLYRGGEKSITLFNDGIIEIKNIREDFSLTTKQGIQRECALSGKPHIDKEGITGLLDSLYFPLHYLDFETFDTAIPLYDGTKPYQKIPFQFSLHILQNDTSPVEHYSFLAEGSSDPRLGFLISLKENINDTGSIIVYNKSFEEARLKELAASYPEYESWIDSLFDRIVDLIVPFRNFHYYNSLQSGSASLKKVLPALVGRGYEDMDIDNGTDASLAYKHITFDGVSDELKLSTRQDLEKYCGRDTEGMIWIIEKLRQIVR